VAIATAARQGEEKIAMSHPAGIDPHSMQRTRGCRTPKLSAEEISQRGGSGESHGFETLAATAGFAPGCRRS
jgi:hypothetical protein